VLAKRWPAVARFRDVRFLNRDKLSRLLPIDVICGGFPCQDISFAGDGAGLDGERSGLWREFARLIGELRPKYAIVENVAALTVRGLLQVLADLAEIGFAAEWSLVSACSVGAPHLRQRLFIVAYPDRFDGRERIRDSYARQDRPLQTSDGLARSRAGFTTRLEDSSVLYGGADGVPFGLERNRAIGNAVVPKVIEKIGAAILEAEGAQ
jgi:DNA (cytosine-5)-methyltransferase 1